MVLKKKRPARKAKVCRRKKVNKYEVFIMELINQMTQQVIHLTILGIKNHLEKFDKEHNEGKTMPASWTVSSAYNTYDCEDEEPWCDENY